MFLQKLVATIHNSYDDENQFHPNKGCVDSIAYTYLLGHCFFFWFRSKDPDNLKVKANIFGEILLAKENLYSKVLIESKYS